MATTTAQDIINRVTFITQDATNVRWTVNELIGWINDGQAAIALQKPDATAKNVATKLIAGTKQTLPADGVRLLDLRRNMGLDGLTAGRAIREVQMDIMDAETPNWHSGVASATVLHYMFDLRDPHNFYVYPPQPASPGYVELVYSAQPAKVAAVTDTIGVDDIYSPVLVDYLLYRCYLKSTDYASDFPRAQAYGQSVGNALGMKMQMDAAVAPPLDIKGAGK